MLLQSSIEASLSFASNHGEQDVLLGWGPTKTGKNCLKRSIEVSRGSSETLTIANMCEASGRYLTRRRRRLLNNSVVEFTGVRGTDEVPTSRVEKDGGQVLPVVPEGKLEDGGDDGADGSVLNSQNGDVPCSEVKCPIVCMVNCEADFDSFYAEVESDNFSLLQLQTKVDSNSDDDNTDVFGLEELDGDTPPEELCVSVLRNWGLIEGAWPLSSDAISELSAISSGRGEMQPCKICGQSENTLNMLLCDHCDEAFHVSCCNLSKKMLPTDEWLCNFCSKKNCKVSTENYFLRSSGTGPIAFALQNPEKYKSRVRIGVAFQAEVPEWSGNISNDADGIGEALEMNLADARCLHGAHLKKFPQAGSISNWLQCREVISDGSRGCAKGTICGKWRRAPFSEVQTDEWDCSCAVTWDPVHSDCAVPQELETEQVLVQLKHIQQLRSRLNAKRRKPSSDR